MLSAHLEDGGFDELALHGVDITGKVSGERNTAGQTVSGEQGRSQRHCAALADKLGSSKKERTINSTSIVRWIYKKDMYKFSIVYENYTARQIISRNRVARSATAPP